MRKLFLIILLCSSSQALASPYFKACSESDYVTSSRSPGDSTRFTINDSAEPNRVRIIGSVVSDRFGDTIDISFTEIDEGASISYISNGRWMMMTINKNTGIGTLLHNHNAKKNLISIYCN